MSRLAEIDALLGKCAKQLRPTQTGVPDVARIRLLVDDLLDERNKLTGVPELKRNPVKSCTMCYQPLKVKRIEPDPKVGGIAVDFTNCTTCDRAKCRCGLYVVDITATKCPSGHWLDRASQASL